MKKIYLTLYTLLLPILTFAAKINPAKLETTQTYTVAMAVSFGVIIAGLIIYYFVWKNQRTAAIRARMNAKAKNIISSRGVGNMRTS